MGKTHSSAHWLAKSSRLYNPRLDTVCRMDQVGCAVGPEWTMVDIRTRDVFATMRPDLLLVQ